MAAAGVIVKYGKTVLLCKRHKSCNFGGHWSVPAGAVEEGETSFGAAERELFEETKIKIERPLEFVMKTDGMKSRGRGGEPFYIYKYDSDEMLYPKLDFEHTEYGWFIPTNLPSPMCENVVEAIKLSLK
tara:strand:+ start:973 stop:1359 length:387 start_codon:yes stop_codon:yes gene_type:complete